MSKRKQKTINLGLRWLTGLLILFFTSSSLAQSPSTISLYWNTSVGCQTYALGDGPRGEKGSVFLEDIQDGVCINFCENSTVEYIVMGDVGNNTVTWSVSGGGTIINQNNTICDVAWGSTGQGNLTFSIVNDAHEVILTKSICINLIVKPTAEFTIMPFQEIDTIKNLIGCTNQMIYFTNLSTANNDTVSLVSYFWDFGDGVYSNAFEPTHSYTHDGNYTITLTVTNSCGCSESFEKKIKVGANGFDIQCPGVVCDHQTETYTLPFDGETLCRDHFNWSVMGGEITSTNQQNGAVTVNWNHTDATGFGYLTFNPNGCSLDCLYPTTIKIPVIQSQGTIQGSTHICRNSQGRYKLPQWPTTDFHWEIEGNELGTLAIVMPTDQRNEVIIQPLVSGTLILKATYQNTLLNCGGIATFTIIVDSFDVEGPDLVCLGSTPQYNITSGNTSDWTLSDSSNHVVDSLPDSNAFSHTFNEAGTYILSVTGTAQCPGSQKTITVSEFPAPPSASGEVIVCPNAPYTYTINNPDPNAQYYWEILNNNGFFVGSSCGTSVIIKFNNVPNIQVLVYEQKECRSEPYTLNISLKTVPASISSASGNVCGNTYADYDAVIANSNPEEPYTDGETYTWSITPPTLGSITTGQGTKHITVLWNNIATSTTTLPQATLTLVIGKCTLPLAVRTFTKQIIINPVLQIGITTDHTTVCSGIPVIFHVVSTNLVPLNPAAVVTWNFGNGQYITGSINQSFTFSNIGGVNALQNVTASIANPNNCLGTATNTAILPMTIAPQPPATLSISSGGNLFCPPDPITTVLSASTVTNATLQWWLNPIAGTPAVNTGQTDSTFYCNAFGTYYFVASNSFGCSSTSNQITVSSFCPPVNQACGLPSNLIIHNNASNNCGTLSLDADVSPTPDNQFWEVIGPGINNPNVSGGNLNVLAGEYNTFFNVLYPCSDGSEIRQVVFKKVIVPYVPDFAVTKICQPNNTFNIELIDKSSFLSTVTNRSILFYIKPIGGNYTLISGTSFNCNPGSYTIKIVLSGNLDDIPQPLCEKEYSFTIAGVPNQTISYTPFPNISCDYTAVNFKLVGSSINTDSYLWTFEPGTTNEATNTLKNTQRVFPSSGTKQVTVVVTNQYGCNKPFSINVNIPNPCFSGTVVASAQSSCEGQPITLQYVPGPNECAVTSYTWMNGTDPVLGAPNAPSIQVYTPGFYWVKVKSSNECVYDTPNRVTPLFKPNPTLHLEGPNTVCSNATFNVHANSNANLYQWFVDNTPWLNFINNNTITLNDLSSGTHILYAMATLDGCTTNDSMLLTVASAPMVPIISQEIYCVNQDPHFPFYHAVLEVSSNVAGPFNWSNGQSGTSIMVTDGGPYEVIVRSGDCSATAQVDVPKNPEDYIWIFPTGCVEHCLTENTHPFLIGPHAVLPYWNWIYNDDSLLNGHDSFPQPLPLTHSGTYNLQISTGHCDKVSQPLNYHLTECETCKLDVHVKEVIKNLEAKYCEYQVVFSIENGSGIPINATLTAPNNDVIVVPSALTLVPGVAGYTITFIPIGSFTGNAIQLELNGTTKEGKPCIYQFEIKLPSCLDGSGIPIDDVGKLTQNLVQTLSMTPNPAQDIVSVQYTHLAPNSTIEIYDIVGNILANYIVTQENGSIEVPTSTYPEGIYIVVVKTGAALKAQQKLIIKK